MHRGAFAALLTVILPAVPAVPAGAQVPQPVVAPAPAQRRVSPAVQFSPDSPLTVAVTGRCRAAVLVGHALRGLVRPGGLRRRPRDGDDRLPGGDGQRAPAVRCESGQLHSRGVAVGPRRRTEIAVIVPSRLASSQRPAEAFAVAWNPLGGRFLHRLAPAARQSTSRRHQPCRAAFVRRLHVDSAGSRCRFVVTSTRMSACSPTRPVSCTESTRSNQDAAGSGRAWPRRASG